MRKFDSSRSILSFGISGAALAIALTAASPALAQSTSTSAIQGHVDGAAADTTVTVTDENTGQRITVKTDANGNYLALGLRPATYQVQVNAEPPVEVVAPVGQTAIADLTTAAAVTAQGGKDIVVTGTRNRTEVRSGSVVTNVSRQQIENLPQSDRNFLNFAALAPGVNVSPPGSNRQVQAGATSPDNTNVFIDGFSLKNPINHGGLSGQNFSQGNPFPQLAVQEFAVNTQNFKAEYEQAGSAIITAVTKTGGQEFHGDAFIEYQPKSFVSRPFFDRPGEANNPTGANPKPNYNREQYGADIGGPIIKDLLHFYFAFEGQDKTSPSTTVNFGAPVPTSIQSQYNGSYPQTFKQRLYFGKLTLFATAKDTINLTGFVRKEKNLADYGGTAVPSHGHFLNNDVKNFQFEWSHRGDHFLNELQVAYSKVDNGTPRVTSGPEINLSANVNDFGNVAVLGANSFVQNDSQKTLSLKDNVTFFAGQHVIKAGVRASFDKYQRTEDSYSNGGYYFNASTYTDFAGSTPYGARISVVDFRPATAKNTQLGAFLQDDWSPDEHWTFNLGLRYDYETNAKNEKFVTPANVAAALRAYPGWQAAGINPNDYISTGSNRHPFAGAFQPRLGVSYDVNGDRNLVFFAGAGRYYDRPLFIESGIETVKNYYQKVVNITFCNPGAATANQASCATLAANNGGTLPPGTIAYNAAYKDVATLRALGISTGLGGDVWLLNNKTKLPYSDQFNVGVRKRFGQIQTSLTFSYVRSNNIFRFVRGNRLPNGSYTSQGDQWVEDNFPTQGQLAGFNGKLNIGSNDGKASYAAIYLTAEKPFVQNSRWGFTAALTIQRARTNVAQELANNDEFYNGPRVDAYGWEYVQGVEKYRFVGTGIVRGPFDTILSGTLTLSSGPAFGNVIFKPNPPENACCYGNFGGVFFPRPFIAYKNLDLRIAKNFKLPWGTNIEFSAAAFNVFDSVNRSYSAWGAGSGTNPTLEENGTTGLGRSFQVGAKFRF